MIHCDIPEPDISPNFTIDDISNVKFYSHSMVAGGFPVTSITTRPT
jgi:hypothetical protein